MTPWTRTNDDDGGGASDAASTPSPSSPSRRQRRHNAQGDNSNDFVGADLRDNDDLVTRSTTPPIPPLSTAVYEDLRARQRAEAISYEAYEDAEEREVALRSSESEGRGERSGRDRVARRANGGDGGDGSNDFTQMLDIREEFHDDAERKSKKSSGTMSAAAQRLAKLSYVDEQSAMRSASSSPTRHGANGDLREVVLGKPPKGTGNYDKPSGDALEPVKASAQRKGGKTGWVRLNASGNINRLSLEKSKIAALLRVPMRDLRVLEPSTSDSYSAAMLCRERAIVVNLEQIKVLITSEEVIMTDSQTATVTHFLPELQARLLRKKRLQDEKDAAAALLLPATLSSVDLAGMTSSQSTGAMDTTTAQVQTPTQAVFRGVAAGSTPSASHSPSGSIDLSQPSRAGTEEVFPFEFVALEVALEMVCNSLEVEANKIELDGKPALEALRKQVNNVNLERVRRMKNRLVRITGRVSKVRDEIQRYLDDDSDMRDMYLTRKAKMENADGLSQHETPPGRARRDQRGGNGHPTTPGRSPLGVHGVHTTDGSHFYDAYDDDKDLQELEDLLETYFTHIDSTFHSLNGLNEYIDDLEDLIEIELDSQRNQLIKLELILTTATLSLTCFSVVVGIFGMNIANDIENKHGMFLLVVILGSFATLGLFLVLLRVCRYYRLF